MRAAWRALLLAALCGCQTAAPILVIPDKAVLASGLDSFHAEMLLSERSEIVTRPTPFLQRGAILRIDHYGRHHMYVFHIGWMPGRASFRLSTALGLATFIQDAGLLLDAEGQRTAYVKTFIELVKDEYQEIIESWPASTSP